MGHTVTSGYFSIVPMPDDPTTTSFSPLAAIYTRLQSKCKFDSSRLDLFTWSTLAIIGNQPIIKLSILAPLLAQVLINKETVTFLANYDLTILESTYWVLIAFFIAQLFYMVLCNKDIKDYPSKVKYTQALNATMSDDELNLEYFDVYKKYFKKYGGAIEVDTFSIEHALREVGKEEIRTNKIDQQSTSPVSTEVAFQLQGLVTSIKAGKQEFPINWNLICSVNIHALLKLMRMNVADTTGRTTASEHLGFMIEHMRNLLNSSHWRADRLRYRFNRYNTEQLAVRTSVGVVFYTGITYFALLGLSNILKVIGSEEAIKASDWIINLIKL